MTTIVATVLTAALAVTSVPVRAQDITLSPKVSFEVSSIKIVNGDARSAMRWEPGGRFTMREPLLRVLSLAYRAPDFRIVGLPGWVRTVFIEIDARANRQVTLDEQRALNRGLLEDRFRAAVHVEQRGTPTDLPSIFTAVQEQLGLKLEPSSMPMSVLVIDRLDMPTEN